MGRGAGGRSGCGEPGSVPQLGPGSTGGGGGASPFIAKFKAAASSTLHPVGSRGLGGGHQPHATLLAVEGRVWDSPHRQMQARV